MLKGDNGEILPLKVFGCVCFVKDNRSYVGKLDIRAVKCVFVGYSPIDVKTKISEDAGEQVDREMYQRLLGKLIYLCYTRHDISFVVNVVSRYMHDPKKGHMDAVYHILRYLKNALGKGLIFRKNGHMNIEDYCDSDWASCQDDMRSTSGYCMFVGGNLVSWQSKKQPVIARSTTKTEYRVMALGVAEML
jgi:hypothetical protein